MPDVKIMTTRVACNTSTGTQDITITGFGTPKAALFILTAAVTDGTAANHCVVSIGATDGTRQWSLCSISENGVAAADTWRVGKNDQCVTVLVTTGSSTIDGEAAYSAFITDGVRINWGNALTNSYLLTVVLFGGADLTARADTHNLNATTSPVTYSSMGFEADALICATHGLGGFASTSNNTFAIAIGLVHNNGAGTITQRFSTITENEGAADGNPNSLVLDDKAMAEVIPSTGAINYEVAFSNFGGSGFDTTSSSASTDEFAFLALNFGGAASAVGTYEPPTSATTSTLNPGFEPQFCLLGLNGCTAVDTNETDSDAGPFGIAVVDAAAQYCNSIAIEDAAATTNTQSLSDDQAINLPAHDGGGFYAATLDGMDSGGVDLNFSAANGTTRKWIYLAVETATGGGGGSTGAGLTRSKALNRLRLVA